MDEKRHHSQTLIACGSMANRKYQQEKCSATTCFQKLDSAKIAGTTLKLLELTQMVCSNVNYVSKENTQLHGDAMFEELLHMRNVDRLKQSNMLNAVQESYDCASRSTEMRLMSELLLMCADLSLRSKLVAPLACKSCRRFLQTSFLSWHSSSMLPARTISESTICCGAQES